MSDFSEIDYWDRRYTKGRTSGERLQHEHEFIVGHVRRFLKPGMEWVDLGCADGELASKALIPGVRYTGVDGSRTILVKAARRLPEHHFICQDITRLVPEADLVTCFNVTYHLPTREKVHAALRNMASTGAGVIMIVGWNKEMATRDLAGHCFYHPLEPPPGYVEIESHVLPESPHKTLLVCAPR